MTRSSRRRMCGRLATLLGMAGVAAAGPAIAATAAPAGAAVPGPVVGSAGALYAWGDNDAGQLGIGTIADAANNFREDRSVPTWSHMPARTEAVTAAAGQSHSLIVTTTGAVYATGYNMDGQLGTGTRVATTSPVPVAMPAGTSVTAVAAGLKQSMALTATGTVYTWGTDNDGQAGNGRNGVQLSPFAVVLPGGATAAAIGAGTDHDLAVTTGGAVYDWGLNSTGQLGDGTTADSNVPVPARLPADVVATAVAGAAGHSLALTSTGAVYAWGDNSDGQLGDGTTVQRDTPVRVALPAGVRVTAIAAGDGTDNGLEGGFSLALASTGAIYAWGDNDSGDLGDGSNTDSDVPVRVQVPAGLKPIAIAAGGDRCHLLTAAGTLYDWGSNEKAGQQVHLTPVLDAEPAGMTPTAIFDGPAAEQYLALMRGSSLWLTKATSSSYTGAGQQLTYSYGITDTGTTSLAGIAVSDDKIAAAGITCPPPHLDVGASFTCTGTYTTTPADVNRGAVKNTATATAQTTKGAVVTSNTAKATVQMTSSG